ncbi:MAG TPA: zf-HC2 domain-containing protein [Acidimicrobiales bacterium]|jgi:hypothetical protein
MSADHLNSRDTCADVEQSLPELALGILSGEERAMALAHLESCERCQGEAERLALTADMLLQLAPEVEPPLGLEVRLFERLGVSVPDPEAGVARRRIGRPLARLSDRGRVLVAAAAVTVGMALGFGGGWVANPGSSVALPAYEHGAASATATLSSDTRAVGTVSTFAGTPGWMQMTVHGRQVSGWVTCKITVTGGKQLTVGRFQLDDGYGAWSARLPVPAPDIRSARVTDSSGGLIGSATFTA